MRTLPGSLWGDANNANNFLLRPAPELVDGFVVTIEVTNYPEVMGEQAGLICYYDDDNYIKFVKESLEGEEWIVLAREENCEPKLINKTAISNESAELKLVLSSGKLEGHFRSLGGDTWQVVDCCKLIEKSNPQIGLFTHGCPSEIERWVEFKNFTVTKDS
jgi:regulation of enolase protein 1 (concanavalin A-like superfamily)